MVEIWRELLDHYARPLPRGAQLTALSRDRGRVQDVNKVSSEVWNRRLAVLCAVCSSVPALAPETSLGNRKATVGYPYRHIS